MMSWGIVNMGSNKESSVSNPDHSALPKRGSNGLGESIISSLSVGVVAFDRDLKVIQANSLAGQLIELGDSIDVSLARGTDGKVWGCWSDFLKSAIREDAGSDFEAVKYQTGGKERLLNIVCTPLRDGRSRKVIGGAVIIADVTEKVDAEYQLAQSERLAAIGKVAGKVAHELNNPMDGILRYINLALRVIDGGDSEKAKEYLDQSRTGLMRMVQVIGELLQFSRSTHHAFEYAAVPRIAADAVKAMEPSRGRVDIQIVDDCPHALPPVKVMSLFQVFCNLIKNATDAMAGDGQLKISINCADDVIHIEFRDTGPGLAQGQAERIFDAFYTTKSHGKGTGLGLSICRDIIEKYGGTITAENVDGTGAVFTVELPLTKKVLQQDQQR